MYCAGFTSLVYGLIFIPLMSLFEGNSYVYYSLLFCYFIFEVLYRAIFYYRFINKPGFLQALKALGVSLLSLAIWSGLTFSIIYWYITSGMSGLFH